MDLHGPHGGNHMTTTPIEPQDGCANCHGMIGELAEGRDPEELCDTCYDDMQASRTTPAASQHSELADMPIDSGMDGKSIAGAEAFWAGLPTGRKWTSLKTHEKALVCHQMDRLEAALRQPPSDAMRSFKLGDRVTKSKGSKWTGKVVGFYSTNLTPEGYAVESETEVGSVQIYPVAALTQGKPDHDQP